MKTNYKIERDEEGTAYITEADGQTRVYAIDLANDEGWVLERQAVGGDESPERVSEHDTEGEALLGLFGLSALPAIVAHLAALGDDARRDIRAAEWDEVMTDALYAACGAERPEEMERARQIAENLPID